MALKILVIKVMHAYFQDFEEETKSIKETIQNIH